MSTYYLDKSPGCEQPYNYQHNKPYTRFVSVTNMIAGTQKLYNSSGVEQTLPDSDGLDDGDLLILFRIPKGFVLENIGFSITTAPVGTFSIDLYDYDGLMTKLSSEGISSTDQADRLIPVVDATDSSAGFVSAENDCNNIILEVNNDDCIFAGHFWLDGYRAFAPNVTTYGT